MAFATRIHSLNLSPLLAMRYMTSAFKPGQEERLSWNIKHSMTASFSFPSFNMSSWLRTSMGLPSDHSKPKCR